MILDISNKKFRKMFQNPDFYLPIRWDGNDFVKTLEKLFAQYKSVIVDNDYDECVYTKIDIICDLIIQAIETYLEGFPSKAFYEIKRLMDKLMRNPLQIYRKTFLEQFHNCEDSLKLYRVTGVSDNLPYDRRRIFHVPYNLRSKISTTRYSIAGFPSLYLGTSLELCCEETKINQYENFAIASRFQIERDYYRSEVHIDVVELAVKPQDFLEEEGNNLKYLKRRRIDKNLLFRNANNYLYWYPLIAACSYIRVNKKAPFAVEYVIPQLLMQWIRYQNKNPHQLIGIRYFSCASIKASEMGFNYVFPSSGRKYKELPYCPILGKSFKLTNPKYINEFTNIAACEVELDQDNDMDYI